MPHTDPQKVGQSPSPGKTSVEQSLQSAASVRSKRDKQEREKEMSPASSGRSSPPYEEDEEETPEGGKGVETKDQDDGSRDSADQGSTQSSGGDSSDYPGYRGGKGEISRGELARGVGTSGSGMTTAASSDPVGEGLEISPAAPGMLKNEENVASASGARPAPPHRGLFRKDSSRKSVRIMEPETGSSGRLSSCRSLDMDDTEDFLIDTNHMDSSTGGSRRNRFNRAESESTHRSFLRELTLVPTDESWDKVPRRSVVWKVRMVAGKIVENPHVQLGIILLIVINAIFMGIATFDFVTDNPDVDKGFDSMDKAFLVVFTIELALQLVYRSFSYFTDAWLVFDFVIVIISWSLESLQIVRAFRIFRAFRLVTRIGPLRELVMAIGAVMPRMYAIAMLLLLIFYIFAVLFTELFRDVETEVNYFGSLDVSLFTCMELMTLEWAGVAREVMEQRSWAWAPILAFLSVTGFIVFNLIVAVVCDAVAVVDREVQAERLGDIETDTNKLEKAQERIWDMTEHVERMLKSQRELQDVLAKLNEEMEQVTGESTGIRRRQSSRMLSSQVLSSQSTIP